MCAARRGPAVRAGRPDARGVVYGLRLRAAAAVGRRGVRAVHGRPSIPTTLLRVLRRPSVRSALAATLATRLVPVLARDAQRIDEARRCRADRGRRGARRARLAVLRAVTSGAMDRALDRGRDARGAWLRQRAGRRGAATPVVAPRPGVRGVGGRARRADGGRARGAGRRPSTRIRRSTPRRGPARSLLVAADARARRAAAVRRPPGDRGDAPVLEFDRVTYTYPGSERPVAARRLADASQAGEFVVFAGLLGGRQVDHAARGLRAGSPLPRRDVRRAACASAGSTRASTGRRSVARSLGSLLPGSRDAGRADDRARRAGVPAREPRRTRPAAVARGVEEAALALGIEAAAGPRRRNELSGGELQRVALGRGARGPTAVVLLDEPTSQLDPVAGDELIWLLRRLNEEWGTAVVLAEHRLERCLRARRPRRRDRRRRESPATRLRASSWPGPATPRRCCRRRRRACSRGGAAPAAVGRQGGARGAARARDLGDPSRRRHRAVDAAARRRRARRGARRRERPRRAGLRRRLARAGRGGAVLLRGVDLVVAPGERVALMGRNGAGKSTLLRHAAGLLEPTRGTVTAAGRVALLLQNPGDYLLHERVGDEASPGRWPPSDLLDLATATRAICPVASASGWRSRSSSATTEPAAAVVCLDEPTRGMDRAAKAALGERLAALAAGGAAVIVATHDAEFAADVRRPRRPAGRRPADRRRPDRRGPDRRLVLRDRDGARPRPRADAGRGRRGSARPARASGGGGRADDLDRRLVRAARARARRRLRLVRAHAAELARGSRSSPRSRRSPRSAGSRSRRCPTSSRRPTSCC